MVGRHSHSRGRRSPTDWKTIAGILLILSVAAVFVAGFLYLYQRKSDLAQIDPSTFCPRSGPVSVHAILIDRTDRLSDLQIEAIRQDTLHWADQVPKHGAFRIYEVGVGGSLLTPVVDVCNPGDGSDASTLNANPAMLKARYKEKFLSPVTEMFDGMRGDHEQATSPIMEAVQAISVRDFGDNGPKGDNNLIIVSDLLQNGSSVNLYHGIPASATFQKSSTARTLHAELSGVGVSIYLINRIKDARFQSNALGEFWISWLVDQGAHLESFRQVPG